MPGDTALGAGRDPVAQAHVGESAAHHDFVVAAPRAVGVEILRFDPVFDQIAPGRAVALDRTGRRNVIGGDAIAQQRQHPRTADRFNRIRLLGHADEIRRQPDVGGIWLELEQIACRNLQRTPGLIAGVNIRIDRPKHTGVKHLLDRFRHFALTGPEVFQID